MSKIEALKYICSNFSGYRGGYQMSCLVDIILEDKELYSKGDLDLLITNMQNY